MVLYNCCLEASIPNSLKRGRLSDMTRAKTPPEMKHCCMAIQERNFQEKKEDSSVKNCLVELNGWKNVSCHVGGVSVCGSSPPLLLLLLLAAALGFSGPELINSCSE